MICAVLFDGAGLARLGLEKAGFDCIGFEIDPLKVKMGWYVGEGNVECTDVTKLDLSQYDIIWASPPCQEYSAAGINVQIEGRLLDWSLCLNSKWLWVENVISIKHSNTWGTIWNAAQFTEQPIQNRNRIIGGRYISPKVHRPYKKNYKEAMSTILASEYKYHSNASNHSRAGSRFNRKLELDEVAYYQGFKIPNEWNQFSKIQQYEAIGNGVPPYMSEAFGLALLNHLEKE